MGYLDTIGSAVLGVKDASSPRGDSSSATDTNILTGVGDEVRDNLPEVDTSIDPSEFASGPVTELAPPEDISAATIGDYTPYTAVDDATVNPDSTVEGRLSGLLSQNNPYIERARLKAAQTANSRGMLNSSMAAGAAEGAAIDRALPIAQQDARAHLEQQFLNQGYSNDEAKALADQSVTRENLAAGLEQDTRQFNATQNFEADKINAAEANKNNFAVLTADLQGQLAGIDNELAMNLEQLSREYAIMENLDTINGALYKEVISGISTILANETDETIAASKVNNLILSANIEMAFTGGGTGGTGGGGGGGGGTGGTGPQTLAAPVKPEYDSAVSQYASNDIRSDPRFIAHGDPGWKRYYETLSSIDKKKYNATRGSYWDGGNSRNNAGNGPGGGGT